MWETLLAASVLDYFNVFCMDRLEKSNLSVQMAQIATDHFPFSAKVLMVTHYSSQHHLSHIVWSRCTIQEDLELLHDHVFNYLGQTTF